MSTGEVRELHMGIPDPLDVSACVEELRLLKDGWLEGGGRAPSHEGLDWLSRVFDAYYPKNLPLPYLYPTEEGGVQAEWSLGPKEVSLKIELRSHSGEWHVLDMETDAVSEQTLNINNANDWKWLVEQLLSSEVIYQFGLGYIKVGVHQRK